MVGFAMTMGLAVQSEAANFNIAKARVGDGIPKSLTGKAGDAKKGRQTRSCLLSIKVLAFIGSRKNGKAKPLSALKTSKTSWPISSRLNKTTIQ
jgi:hypothetical protein